MYFATAEEIFSLDELAVENGLEIRQMMEIAGYSILELFRRLDLESSKNVTFLIGKGNKGGDGLCAARHLTNNGYEVEVVLLSTELSKDSEHQLELIKKMGIKVTHFNKIKDSDFLLDPDVIVDALIGYRLKGSPRGDYGEVIRIANESDSYKIAYDIPTGIEAGTGKCYKPCFKADATLTLAVLKKAFEKDTSRKYTGELFLADIGIPSYIYDQVKTGIKPDFEKENSSLIKIYSH